MLRMTPRLADKKTLSGEVKKQSGLSKFVNDPRMRVNALRIGIALFFLVVIVRLADIQIVHSANYREMARRQYQANVPLPATRGVILDRKGNLLASNTEFASYAADPKLAAEDADAIAAKFSEVFHKPKKYYLSKLKDDSRFVWLERQVSPDLQKKIKNKKFSGLVMRMEPKRLYHNDRVAGQLIGVTNIDNEGLAGIELAYDDELRGTDGYVIFQRDGLGRAWPSVDYPRVEPVKGHNITLTIDRDLQAIAEKALQDGVKQNEADRGVVVIMEPATGEVLALGQYPAVDPNNFGKYDQQDQRLRPVTDVFEPGSVFKLVTVSAALEDHLISPEKVFFAENGKYFVSYGNGKSRQITDTHEYGNLTFKQAMELSSNIVMAKASDIIGNERMYKMARAYGFGTKTRVEFPGEVPGLLNRPTTWSGLTRNSLAYGYEVQATALQVASAYCAVANKGILMKPMLFKRETDASGVMIRENQSAQIRRVISEQTAEMVKNFLVGVVEDGTGKQAKLRGIQVAGKTGTSKKLVDGRYEPGSYRASFVGYFPADKPELVCFVMMDNPRGTEYTGGMISAPIFRSIAEQIVNTSDRFAPKMAATLPAEDRVSNHAVKSPQEKFEMPAIANTIPDVRGYSVRQAVMVLRNGKLVPVVTGSGIVVNENPTPGTPAKPGMKITLICQPKSDLSLSSN